MPLFLAATDEKKKTVLKKRAKKGLNKYSNVSERDVRHFVIYDIFIPLKGEEKRKQVYMYTLYTCTKHATLVYGEKKYISKICSHFSKKKRI